MILICLGFNHHTAPLALRERLNYAPDAVAATLEQFVIERPSSGLTELALLSTCNRLEVYAAAPELEGPDGAAAALDALQALILATRGLAAADLAGKSYQHLSEGAALHLCRVAAGLDSMVLGEPQILGQVNSAYQLALVHGSAGPLLSALFRTALHAGKRVRSETAISQLPMTISSAAIHMAEAAVGELAGRHVLVLGAGDMGALAVAALAQRGAHITVVNRTLQRAAALAERWQARALPYERLDDALAEADVVVAASAAPQPPITAGAVQAALARRPARPLAFVDMAVPRNVEATVRTLPNVRLFDLDDLEAHLDGARAGRQAAAPQAEAIAAAEAQAFAGWLADHATARLIAELHAKADVVRQAEVARTLRHLPNLSEAERAHVEALAQSLVNKLLHTPTARLRGANHAGQTGDYATALRDLFALDG